MTLPTDVNLYIYQPSTALAIVFAVLYAIVQGAHVFLSIFKPCRNRATLSKPDRHRYTIPLVVAASLNTTGYIVRAVGIQGTKKSDIILYSISSSYLVISPIFICATLYLLLARMMRRCLGGVRSGEGAKQESESNRATGLTGVDNLRFLGISPEWLGRIFIMSDVTSFLTQGAGSAISASGNWTGAEGDIGIWVLRVGLILQLITFIVYLVIFALFWRRAQQTRPASLTEGNRKLAFGAIIASVFVLIRSIYRVAEFFVGIEGYLFQNEWPLYVFEAVAILLALSALAWWHPMKCLDTNKPYEGNLRTLTEDSSC